MNTKTVEYGWNSSEDSPADGVLPEIASLQATLRGKAERLALPTSEVLPDELLSIADELERLTGEWNAVDIYTPSGALVASERERFLEARARGERVEPAFTYPNAERMNVASARAALRALDERVRAFAPTDDVGRMARVALHFKIEDDLATCDVIEGIRTKDETLIKRGLEKKYPGTDPLLVERAEAAYREECIARPMPGGSLTEAQIAALKAMIVDADGQREAFTWALGRYGMLRSEDCPDGFNVVVSEHVTSIDVRDKCEGGPTVFVPAKRDGQDIDALELCALIDHEIGGHARHAMNGRRLFRLGGAMLRTDDETLYEGQGMRRENDFMRKHAGANPAPEAPLYVLAVALAERGKSFSEIVDDQEQRWLHVYGKIPADQPIPDSLDAKIRDKALKRAYRTAYRVMRGHVDMKNAAGFAMAKDLAYFRGTALDEQLRSIGLGVVNDAAIMSTAALPMVARFNLQEETLPFPFQELGHEYLETRFLPNLRKQ